MELTALLDHPAALPSMPRTVALLMTELACEEPHLRRVTQLISTDPALAAHLLEMANSPTFQLQGRVAGVAEAVALVGTQQLRQLVASAAAGATSRSVPGVNLQHFWRCSLHTAKLARLFASLVYQNPSAAYTAGLLHALGELLIHLANPEKAQSVSTLVAPLDMRRAKVEQRIFGYHYGHVSAALAGRWRLPQMVVDALHYQGTPFENKTYEPLAGVLHLASWRARAREAGLDEKETTVTFPGEVSVMLGLDMDTVLQQDPINWTARPEPEEAGYTV